MTTDARESFAAAADGYVELVASLGPGDWARPGLGEWDVRQLVGHASRALSTVATYLGQPSDQPVLPSAAAYFAVVRNQTPEVRATMAASIAARGREAGKALGDDPVAFVRALSDRVLTLVAASPDDAPVASAAGTLALVDYLPTRTFELTVHSLDVAHALGVALPERFASAVAAGLELAAQVAATLPDAGHMLLLMTGRSGLPAGLSVV